MGINKKSIIEFVQKHNKPVVFVILVLILGIIFSLVNISMGDFLTYKSYDMLVKYIGGTEEKPHKDVMLILIDENSLRYGNNIGVGRWPWSRNIYPEILNFINSTDPPKGIFFDIFFVESDLGEGNDAAFGEGIAVNGNVFQNIFLETNDEKDKAMPLPPDIIKHFTVKVEDAKNIEFEEEQANEYSVPIPCLRSSVECSDPGPDLKKADPIAAGFSVASFNPETDGIFRRGGMLFKYQDQYFSSMSLSAIRVYSGESNVKVLPDNMLQVGKYKIPVDSEGKYIVNYYKEGNRITPHSMSSLMLSAYYLSTGEIDKMTMSPEDFKDKIIIIGCSAPGCQDRKNTPINERMPGPEIHASMVSNILQGNHIVYASGVLTFLIMLGVILICVGAIIFVSSNLWKLLILISVLAVYIVTHSFLFNSFNYLSPILLIFGSGIISSGISFIYLSMTEGAEKRKYSKILGNMIDPQIVSEALNDLEGLKKGGEKNITAFFSDIASFSTISEKLSSVDLAALLNEYLSAMTDILKSHSGTLDKYIGDAVVGIFGAPMDNPDHAIHAARASLKMNEKLAILREKWTANNDYCQEAQQMTARIGLNTGLAKVGFMGTENLASYTMMGDTVNLAARLEAAGKDYGVEILISDMTKSKIQDEMVLRLLDAVRVKGKTEPVYIYELIGIIGQVPENIVESTELYQKAFNMYKERAFEDAIKVFKNSAKAKGEVDKSTKLLINRCTLYKKTPPPDNWDGVFTRTTK